MREVKIFYVPYIRRTRLIIDGEGRAGGTSRLEEFVIGRSLDNWLAPYVFSYQRWNGILPELMNDLNDDELEIYFFIPPEYFTQVKEEFARQSLMVEADGYSSKKYRLHCVERFLPQKVRTTLLRFVSERKTFAPDQYSMNLFDYIEYALENSDGCSIEDLCKICDDLQNALNTSKNFCQRWRRMEKQVHLWENAQRELQKIINQC